MTADTVDRVRPDWRWRLSPLAGILAILALGTMPTLRLAPDAGLLAMAAAVSLVGAVVLVTLQWGFLRVGQAAPRDRFTVILQIGMVRFMATLAMAGSVAWSGWFDHALFLIWTGIAYVVMTLFETVVLTSWCKRIEG